MQMHLFSSSDPMLENVIRVSKKHLQDLAKPVVLYIPPQIKQEYVYLTKQAFQDLADVRVIDLRSIEQHQFQQVLQETSLIFVPGGNTFYLNFQLHQKGLIRSLCQIIHDGVPYIGVSAGTLITGENILTSNDINSCGCTVFTGLQMVLYNFLVHFPANDSSDREGKIDRIASYHEFHGNSVLALEDGAYLWVNDDQVSCESENIWLIEKGKEPVNLQPGVMLRGEK